MSEVATFVSNLDQFEAGKSEFKCVEYGVADIYYCGPPNGQPSGSVSDVSTMADADYVRFIGPDVTSDVSGTSIPQLDAILASHNLVFVQLPVSNSSVQAQDILEIKNALGNGLPLLVVGDESGFVDVEMGRVPYAWTPSGTHCIVVSGVAPSGNLLVHDYAAINPTLYEPGTVREYANDAMFLVSAFSVKPRWFGGVSVPAMVQAAEDCWDSTRTLCGGTPPRTGTGIYKDWESKYVAGKFMGPPLTQEYNTVNWNGQPVVAQEFAHARCEWQNNAPLWYART